MNQHLTFDNLYQVDMQLKKYKPNQAKSSRKYV